MLDYFHKVYKPHDALREFVNNITIQRVMLDPLQPKPVFPMPPIQEQALFFYPFDPIQIECPLSNERIELPESVIVAKRLKMLNVFMGHNHLVVKIGFQPGGLFRLLGIPISELQADDMLNASEDLLGREIPLTLQQLKDADSYNKMAAVLESWLLGKLAKLKNELPIDKALPSIIKTGTLHNISEIASQSCVSIRQLERLYKQRIGLSPQHYARLVRFTKAWIKKENNHQLKWTNLAYECGYFDQMHLIRDFKEFTGIAPSLIQKDLQDLPCSLQHEVFH
jgi:AraC-like DNA-binding protein